MRLRSLAIFVALSACALAPAAISAQSTSGRVSGIVNDENNKPIKAATVEAEHTDTNQTFTATTDEKGRFTFIGLRPGPWQFTGAAPGFFSDRGTTNIRVGTPNPPIVFVLKKTGVLNGGVLGNVQAKDLHSELLAADQLFSQRKWDEAIAAYRSILEKTPTLSIINLQIGNALLNKKDYDAAINAYGDLLKVDPLNAKAAVGVANVETARGNPDRAEAALRKVADTPGAVGREVYDGLGEIEFAKGNTDEAIKWYKKAADADKSWGKPLYKLGIAAQKSGDIDGARQYLNKVLAIDPVSPEAAMARATLEQLNP